MDAKLNVTYSGENGDLVDMVPFDTPDDAVIQMAREALQPNEAGVQSVPGITPVRDADFTDYRVFRYPAKDDLPNRIVLRPKTPFGHGSEWR